MSSILEALKKVEQESSVDRSAGTPWPTALATQTSYRQRSRRWWGPLGLVAGLCVVALVFWQVRQPETTRILDSVPPEPPVRSRTANPQVLPPDNEAPKPSMPAAQQQPAPPAKTLADVATRQSTENASASSVQGPNPMVRALPVQPENKPQLGFIEESDPIPDPAQDFSRPISSANTAGQARDAPADTQKVFKTDPRIDLQALVWAPESAARFVIINNRLVKEGGSLDNIVVVQINPDDVLLAEGSDRWYQAFKIR